MIGFVSIMNVSTKRQNNDMIMYKSKIATENNINLKLNCREIFGWFATNC